MSNHDLLRRREQALKLASNPLPGSIPYDNVRPFHVPARCDHWRLADCLREICPERGLSFWIQRCHEGQVFYKGIPAQHDRRIRAGERYEHIIADTTEPDVNTEVRVVFEDDYMVVVDKPAPLPMHPSGRFNRNTLIHLLNLAFAPLELKITHRLDANTTGLVVLAKERRVAADLKIQFERGMVLKEYLAKVHGAPEEDFFKCEQPISSRPIATGAREICEMGKRATTEFSVVARLGNGNTLLRAAPKTGRTNQIRVHLKYLGFPILGDPTYAQTGQIGDRQTLEIDAAAMCLHAWKISLAHPVDRHPINFESGRPTWALA